MLGKKKYDPKAAKVFREVLERLKTMFPSGSMTVGFHTEGRDLYEIGFVKKETMSPVSAAFEVRKDGGLDMRIYRAGGANASFKVDTYTDVDKPVRLVAPKGAGHYISTDIPENIMGRRNISVKFEVNEEGKLAPKFIRDNVVEAIINFEK